MTFYHSANGWQVCYWASPPSGLRCYSVSIKVPAAELEAWNVKGSTEAVVGEEYAALKGEDA